MELKRPVVRIVAQVVQQVDGQEAEHVAQEGQAVAAQAPQQAVGQAQLGEFESRRKNFADLQKSFDELTRLLVATVTRKVLVLFTLHTLKQRI